MEAFRTHCNVHTSVDDIKIGQMRQYTVSSITAQSSKIAIFSKKIFIIIPTGYTVTF